MTTDSDHGENYPTSSEAHVLIPLREHYTRSISQDQLNYRREQIADGRRTARGTAGTADTAASPAAALASATCATRCWGRVRPNLAKPWATPGTSAGRHAGCCKEALERTASPSTGRHNAAAGIVKPRGKQWRNCSKEGRSADTPENSSKPRCRLTMALNSSWRSPYPFPEKAEPHICACKEARMVAQRHCRNYAVVKSARRTCRRIA